MGEALLPHRLLLVLPIWPHTLGTAPARQVLTVLRPPVGLAELTVSKPWEDPPWTYAVSCSLRFDCNPQGHSQPGRPG